jgi:hypothetical protein
MNKFHEILSRNGDKILKDRAENVSLLAAMAHTALINDLKKKKIELDFKKKELIDLSPDNRYSLKIGKDFDGDKWVREYQDVSIKLINIKIELKVAEDTEAELFTEEAATASK